jgi:cephalosporin-C deacetylase-like acetyl esterase
MTREELEFNFLDSKRSRKVQVLCYLPKVKSKKMPVVIFGPGYEGQEEIISQKDLPVYKGYTYLADYFTKKGYAFITIQHDILGDDDGLESVDPNAIQHEARKHLYVRGVENMLFVIEELKKHNLGLDFEKLIVSGHSNGGDISKYFANLYSNRVSKMILFEARRCRFEITKPIDLLMFEADDTSTDLGVMPIQNKEDNHKRENIDWSIIKPKDAIHVSYMDDYITDKIKTRVYKALDYFL